MASRTGTEVNVRDIAVGLLRRGHQPVVYSPDLGEMAAEIRAATVPVVDDLAAVAAVPEVIHGHHHTVTLEALLRFPGVPAIYFVHDWSAWHDAPLRFPRVALYAPVDATNADRLVLEGGIPPERTRLVLNAVDLRRFRPRPPLPPRPERALVFSNYASEVELLPDVREACRRAGLELAVAGAGVGASASSPERLLPGFDLVFAKARCALEALAVGAAVVLCDGSRMGPLVTSGDFDRLRQLNFGRRSLADPLSVEGLLREIGRYDADDAARVSQRVREEAGLDAQLDDLLSLYEEAIALGRDQAPDPVREAAATADYLVRWAPQFAALRSDRRNAQDSERRLAAEADVRARAEARLGELERTSAAEAEALRNELTGLRATVEHLHAELDAARAQNATRLAAAEAARDAAEAARAAARSELEWINRTATWRLRARLLRSRPVRWAWALLRHGRGAGRS